MGPEDYDKIEKELEAEEMRARALERELADQREAFERAQRALARERDEKVQQEIEFEEREMEMKAQQKEMKAQMEMGMKALEKEKEDRKIEMERERERQAMKEELTREMQEIMKAERETRDALLITMCMKGQGRNNDQEDFELKSSGLSISDASVDILAELAGIAPLTAKHRKQQNGIQTVTTVTDLFETAMKSPSLQKIFAEKDEGSLRFALSRFGNSLVSMKQCGETEKMVCTLLAVDKYFPALANKLVAGITMAAAVKHEVRTALAQQLAEDGRSIAVLPELMQRSLEELPGIAELVSSDWDAEHVKSFADLVLSYVCFESDVTGKLAQAKSKWLQISGTGVTECEDYLAAEKKAFDICSSWFGKEVDTDFHRFELLLEKSPEAVKSAYVQHLSSPENRVTESSVMRMEYADMLTVFQTVWNAAKVSLSVSSRLNMSQAQNQSQSWSAVATPRHTQQRQVDRPAAGQQQQSQSQGSHLTDMSLNCRVCSESFVFTVQQQITNKERGYNNVPTKCQDHRTPGNCDQFTATGSCDYGDQCKFQHIGADGRSMNEQGNAQSGKTAFRDLAPGSLKRYCKYNEDENCHLGDNCPFTHKGREIAQEELAVKKEQALKSAASSSSSGPPQYGRSGLSRAAE